MASVARWVLVGLLLVIVGVVPIVFFRFVYGDNKRLREVVPGRVYRSGQMTAEGFASAVKRLGIRTIINVQDDYPDPQLAQSFWSTKTIAESELCRQLDVRYLQIDPDLISRKLVPEHRPRSIEEVLRIFDDETRYPILLHCKAGLHRTGVLMAVYRMEYQGWSPRAAYDEMKSYGFGNWVCTAANEYVTQFVLTYRPGLRLASDGTLKPR
jgi:tyrosine-protein phosphatase SIW14